MLQLTSVPVLPDVVIFFSSIVVTPNGFLSRCRIRCILPRKETESSQYLVPHGLNNDAVECPGTRDISVYFGMFTVSSPGTVPCHLVCKWNKLRVTHGAGNFVWKKITHKGGCGLRMSSPELPSRFQWNVTHFRWMSDFNLARIGSL
jgi:hypothetical protein